MQYADLKQHFISTLLMRGENSHIAAPPEVKERVPEAILQRWTEKFYKAERFAELPEKPRLLNHFKLGADPEFALVSPLHGLQNAEGYGLQSGLAFGADNNGRLVELRPEPSRFALEVVASMLSELRWMALCRPKLLQFQWKAGAWSGHDGLGGHVHFGRKVERQQPYEVDALDRLTDILLRSEIFPNGEQQNRRRGQGNYGAFGDVRTQRHGYEYRTSPSWLDSPWKAYLFITLAKLTVARPEFVLSMPSGKFTSATEARKFIRNMLATYKGLDDDARIASVGYTVWGLPGATPLDFKAAWGIGGVVRVEAEAPKVIPGSIKATRSDVEEVFRHLCNGTGLLNRLPTEPNWDFHSVPKGFLYPMFNARTTRSPGYGELLCDLVTPLQLNIGYQPTDKTYVEYSPQVERLLDADALNALRKTLPNGLQLKLNPGMTELYMHVSRGALSTALFNVTKGALVSGVFPIHQLKDATPELAVHWTQLMQTKKAVKRPKSVVLVNCEF